MYPSSKVPLFGIECKPGKAILFGHPAEWGLCILTQALELHSKCQHCVEKFTVSKGGQKVVFSINSVQFQKAAKK